MKESSDRVTIKDIRRTLEDMYRPSFEEKVPEYIIYITADAINRLGVLYSAGINHQVASPDKLTVYCRRISRDMLGQIDRLTSILSHCGYDMKIEWRKI